MPTAASAITVTITVPKPAPPSRRYGHSAGSVWRITTALTTRRAANWKLWIRSRRDAMVRSSAQAAHGVEQAEHAGGQRTGREGQQHVEDVGEPAQVRRRGPAAEHQRGDARQDRHDEQAGQD